jgi:general secretion pathway protein G
MSRKRQIVVAVAVVFAVACATIAINYLSSGAAVGDLLRSTQYGVNSLAVDCLRYNHDMNTFPPNLDALFQRPTNIANSDAWAGPYGKPIMLDPWGNPFQYRYPSLRHGTDKPDVWSFGSDGKNGTDDDIVNQ